MIGWITKARGTNGGTNRGIESTWKESRVIRGGITLATLGESGLTGAVEVARLARIESR